MATSLTKLKSKAVKTEPYNSTNAWGFGGRVGTVYTFANGLQLFIGKFYYRHAPASKSVCFWGADGLAYIGSEEDFIKEVEAL